MPAQLAEQLLEVRQRNLLAPADRGQRHGPGVLAQREVDHGGDGKTAFGGQTHGVLLKTCIGAARTGTVTATNRRFPGLERENPCLIPSRLVEYTRSRVIWSGSASEVP